MTLSDHELAYLAGQPLGRLATVDPDGAPQNNPVGFRWNPATGTVDIGGHALAGTRKFRNVTTNHRVALVVDDLLSTDPWRVRGLEIRGWAEALRDQPPWAPGFSGELIRVHPVRVISWGLDPDRPGMHARTVAAAPPAS